MIQIPIRVDYGVRALVDLAQHHGHGPTSSSTVATRQGIPEQYLNQLLALLNRSGIVKSKRGPHGGHMLALSPNDITLTMVMSTLEQQVAPLDCLHNPSDCDLSPACAQREMWRSIEEALDSVLDSTTIGYLARRQRELSAAKIPLVQVQGLAQL